MTIEDKRAVLGCATVTGPYGKTPIAGSTIHKCEKCGTDVWIAPSGVQAIANGTVDMVWCMPCVMGQPENLFGDSEKYREMLKKGEAVPPLEEQLQEVADELRRRSTS